MLTGEYRLINVDIEFGKHSCASMRVSAGDIDGSSQDWVEGSYVGLNELAESFTISDEGLIEILNKDYGAIVFDPDKKIYKKINGILTHRKDTFLRSKKSVQKVIKDCLLMIITGVIIGWLIFLFKWN